MLIFILYLVENYVLHTLHYRTPSMAEKLLADWLAFNLYSHLQGSPSISIYELFLGFKRHLESGPVDILNAKATNSLSEEKLLLEEIRYTVRILFIPFIRLLQCILACNPYRHLTLR